MKFTDRIKLLKISAIKNSIGDRYRKIVSNIIRIFQTIKKQIADTRLKMAADVKERNRILLLAFSALFVLDYVMVSYHIDKNVFNIFPSIPVLEERKEVNIYLPSEGCKEIITEKREVYSDLEDESLVRRLFKLVADGSYFENTSENVPAAFLIKKVWFAEAENGEGKVCVIDLSPITLEKEIVVVKGSEQMFKDALEKTITENIPGIKKIILLEKGGPFRKLWEI